MNSNRVRLVGDGDVGRVQLVRAVALAALLLALVLAMCDRAVTVVGGVGGVLNGEQADMIPTFTPTPANQTPVPTSTEAGQASMGPPHNGLFCSWFPWLPWCGVGE
jgi:hypothetical protein